MELHDKKIKTLIERFKSGKEDIHNILNDLRREVELYIYNFPRLAYKKGPDICSEFYLYVLERLGSIIENFPLNETIQFKTWFNAVLRNQLTNFFYYHQKDRKLELSLEDYENDISVDVFEKEELDLKTLMKGLSSLNCMERLSLLFFYMPECLEAEDIKKASESFKMSIQEILAIQRSLIVAREKEIQRIREISDKIGKYSQTLARLKYKLYKGSGEDLKIKNELLQKIARNEASRARLVRLMEAPDKAVFREFSALFRNALVTKRYLKTAKRKLRIILLTQKKMIEEAL